MTKKVVAVARKEHATVKADVVVKINIFNRIFAISVPAIVACFLACLDMKAQDIIAIVSVVGAGANNYISNKSVENRTKP